MMANLHRTGLLLVLLVSLPREANAEPGSPGAAAALQSSAAARPPAQPASPASAPSGLVLVHLEGHSEIELRRVGGRFGHHVCFAPCDTALELAGDTQLVLEGGPSLPAFKLEPGKSYTLRIDGNKEVATTGLVAGVLGFSTLTATGFGFLLNWAVAGAYGDDVPPESVAAYSATMGCAALLMAIGLPIGLVYEPELVVEERGTVSVKAKGTAIGIDARGMRVEF